MKTPPRERITALRARAERAKAFRQAVEIRLSEVRKQVHSLEGEETLLDLVTNLFRTLIDTEVTDGVKAVEKLQTEGLQAVFADMDLSVRSDVDIARGKVSVELVTVQKQPNGDITEAVSTEAYGGSITAVQSVLMRIIVILRRGMRPVLFLDESLGAVAEDYVPAVGKFLATLCERLDMDILAVTHNPALIEAADRAYRIQKVGTSATFKQLH